LIRRAMPKRENRLRNRLRAVMAHTTRYAFFGSARLAADAGISKSALSRLAAGKSNPRYEVVAAITSALERGLKRPVDPRDLIALGGDFPTRSACEVAGCRGCLPDWFYEADGSRRDAFRDVRPGEWTGLETAGKEAQ
jgi:transcriptional regulator with XRE-family HTH domain